MAETNENQAGEIVDGLDTSESLSNGVNKDKLQSHYVNAIIRTSVSTLFHPIQRVKVLAQLGYEPWPLSRGKSLIFMGNATYFLPNVFSYMRLMSEKDGYSILYTGVAANICGNLLGNLAAIHTNRRLKAVNSKEFTENATKRVKAASETDKEAIERLIRRGTRDSIVKTAAIVVSRPLHVVMIRQMAQYIGGDTIYVGVISSLKDIYKEEGLSGLFKGLVPQLLAELSAIWLVEAVSYLLERTLHHFSDYSDEDDSESSMESSPKDAFRLAIPYLVQSVVYPLHLVSTVYAVNSSGLSAGSFPFVPKFDSWRHCFSYLSERKLLKRGAKLFLRHYSGPVTYRAGSVFAMTTESSLLDWPISHH